MKKLIISALLIVFGSVYAMAQDAQDTEMAMEAAPSVAISGSAKMGLLHDGALSTVGEYDVKFASSGVTDGGLTFGGSITIDSRDSNSITGDGFGVYVGSADGSWKLQFGDNDEGIATVGGFGVADPDDGVFRNTTTFVGGSVTVIPPVAEVLNDDGVDAMPATGELAGGTSEITFDTDGSASLVPTADLDEGVSQDIQTELVLADAVIIDAETTFTILPANLKLVNSDNSYYWVYTPDDQTTTEVEMGDDPRTSEVETNFDEELVIYRHSTWLTDDVDDAADDELDAAADKRFTFDVTMSRGYQAATDAVPPTVRTEAVPQRTVVTPGTPVTITPNNRTIALSGSAGPVTYSLTSGVGNAQDWSIGAKYDAGVAQVGFGINSTDVIAFSVGNDNVIDVGEFHYQAVYVRRSDDAVQATGIGLLGSYNTGGGLIELQYSRVDSSLSRIDLLYSNDLGGGLEFYTDLRRTTTGNVSANRIETGIKMSF